MENQSHLTSIAAGIIYAIASFRMIRLNRRTGEHPELLLGLYFACSGQWYLVYYAPDILGFNQLPPLIESGIEWIYALGFVPYLLFIRGVFRPAAAWATGVMATSSLLLLAGCVASSLRGGFTNSIDDPAYLIEWVGYTVPCIWMSCEAIAVHRSAKRRVRIGLCDPIVANRYLLFAVFGFVQLSSCAADLVWAREVSSGAPASSLSDVLLAATEIASAAVLTLVFFPPQLYSDWINRRAAIPSVPVD